MIIADWDTLTTVWSRPLVSIARVCFSPGSERVVSSSFDDGAWSLLVWDADDGQRQGRLAGHTNVILGMRFTEDGTLYSWSTDGTLREWDLERFKETKSFAPALKDAC
jgi:WD40 repeat protein